MLLTRQQILRVVLNRTPRARNGSDSAIAIVIKIFIRRESAGKIGGKPIRTKTRHLSVVCDLHTAASGTVRAGASRGNISGIATGEWQVRSSVIFTARRNDCFANAPSAVLLRNATPSVFHQRHIGRVLR